MCSFFYHVFDNMGAIVLRVKLFEDRGKLLCDTLGSAIGSLF